MKLLLTTTMFLLSMGAQSQTYTIRAAHSQDRNELPRQQAFSAFRQRLPQIGRGGRYFIRPLDQPHIILFTQLSLLPVQILPRGERFLSPEEPDRQKMLDSLIFDRCLKRGNKKIQTLSAEPFRPELIQRIRILLPHQMEQRELVLPFRLDHTFRGQPGPDPGPLKAPVRPQPVLLLIEHEIRIPPLKKRHDRSGQCVKKRKF